MSNHHSCKKKFELTLLFLSFFLFLSLTGCSDSEKQARNAAKKYLSTRFSGGEHSFQFVSSCPTTIDDYDSFTITYRTDDDKYTFEVTPYKTYYEFPFAFTIEGDVKRVYNSNFATTIMNDMASEKYFKLMNLSDAELLRVVKEMHEFADDIRSELTAYAANDYHKDTVLYTAQICYGNNVYEYIYNFDIIDAKSRSAEKIASVIKETIEGNYN